ncbi:hypothetical protein [Bradyrhizobium sp. LTSP885]|uniref:hypothetical protein n=1 Tax=Bradyrhizobium sp. LTSP885 TaxID=1619232 RepID=UPI000B18BDD8|nr:hypothetical protein [Bradyrhizobium sp. LTSP885]
MDILEFVQRSEWPVLIGGALWYFRRPLYQLVDRVRPTKVSAWGVSIELDKVEALTVETRAATEQELPKLEKPKSTGDLLTFHVDEYEHPQMVVLKSWSALEAELYRAYGKSRPPGVMRVMEQVAKELGLTSNEVEAIRELRSVRNRVAHLIGYPLSQEDAQRYSALARDLILRIRTLKPTDN